MLCSGHTGCVRVYSCSGHLLLGALLDERQQGLNDQERSHDIGQQNVFELIVIPVQASNDLLHHNQHMGGKLGIASSSIM